VTERRTAVDFAQGSSRELAGGALSARREGGAGDGQSEHAQTRRACIKPSNRPWLGRLIERLEIHHTPKHGSWLNMAEIELSVLSQQCLNRRIPDATTLVREVAAWQQARNADPRPVNWRFTTADARIKLKRLYPSIQVG
jgi:hypothetical protein